VQSRSAKKEKQSMKGHLLNNQRGSALLFTTVMLVLLLVFGGIAIDLTYFGSTRRELQRSMDAAALAGAGNLGFNATAFPTARAAAQTYAGLNGYSDLAAGPVNLNLNTANNPNGDIVLGIWNGANFTPSLNGSQVNAVLCQYARPLPTSFLRLLGMSSLALSAQAIAVTYPPLNPPTPCVFPMALSGCAFTNAGAFNSLGCGSAATFISSSGQTPGTNAGTNTAAWANLCGTSTPSAPETSAAITGAATGSCSPACATPQTGTTIGTNNGMQQSVFDLLETTFVQQFNQSGTHQVTDSSGNVSYNGPGWKVFVPVIQTTCPPGPISGPHQITSWAEMVITQVYDRNNGCAVSNPADSNSWSICPQPLNPSGPSSADPNLRAVFGRYNCTLVPSPPSPLPGPISAIATNLRLVR
jgi:Flp pilus assembly protein TadG